MNLFIFTGASHPKAVLFVVVASRYGVCTSLPHLNFLSLKGGGADSSGTVFVKV